MDLVLAGFRVGRGAPYRGAVATVMPRSPTVPGSCLLTSTTPATRVAVRITSNPLSNSVRSIVTQHGANQGAQCPRAFPRPQQVGHFSTSSVGLGRASHQCPQYICLRRTIADTKHPEPTDFGSVCSVFDSSRNIRLGIMGGLQTYVRHIGICSPAQPSGIAGFVY